MCLGLVGFIGFLVICLGQSKSLFDVIYLISVWFKLFSLNGLYRIMGKSIRLRE